MPNRRQRTRQRDHGPPYLAILLILTALLVAGGVLLQTGAFSLVTLGRSGSVDIVNDDDGAVRLSINPCLRDKHQESLVTVTNRLAVTASYEVSLDQPSWGTLHAGGGSGDTVGFTLVQGGSETVDMTVNITGPYPKVATFGIEAVGPGTVFEAQRGTFLDKKNGCGVGTPTPTVGTPPPGNQPPIAQFTYTRQNKNKADLDGSPSTDPDGTVVSWQWDIGNDGSVDYTGQTVGSANVPTGTPVKLTVTDNNGATDSIVKTVDGGATPQPSPTPTASPPTGTATATPANQPPMAAYTFTRQNKNKVDLDASGSSDPDGTIVSYEWDVGDDGSIEYTGVTVVNANVPEGTAVTLVVTDDGGATASTTQTLA